MKKLEDYNWICPQPFINTVKRISGNTKPCCVVKGSDDWNSDQIRNFRNEFLIGDGPLIRKYCEVCVEQEKYTTESHRNMYLSRFYGQWKGYKEPLERYLETDWEEPYILTLEYCAPDNYCNLSCNMCSPSNSSSLALEDLKINHERMDGKIAHVKRESNIKDYDLILQDLRELKLTGGETLAIKENYDLMNRAVELGVADNIDLMITTNATLIPKFDGKDIFYYIPLFKSVQMSVSIEFWGEMNDYLRYGSKWDVVLGNAHRFAEVCDVYFTSTLNALNVGYHLDLALMVEEVHSLNDNFSPYATGGLIFGPGEMYTLSSVPSDIRELYLDYYDKNMPQNLYEKFVPIISYLKNIEYDEDQMWTMLKDIKVRDKLRGTCLPDLFPEWKPYYFSLS